MNTVSLYDNFREIVFMLHQNNNINEHEKEKLIHSFNHNIGVECTNHELLSHFVGTSLIKRINNDLKYSDNIYLETFDIPQIILFDQLVHAYPHIPISYDIANLFMAKAMEGLEEITIFEIGIGKGKQLVDLIKNVASGNNKTKKINIIALDPDIQNIRDSEKNLTALGENLNIKIKFHSILGIIENLTTKDYELIKHAGKNIIINAAYALHHTTNLAGDYEYRTKILEKLYHLKPLLFTLIEPNSNHNDNNIFNRFENCWKHYETVFDLIDKSEIDSKFKFNIKSSFFGREIMDILSTNEDNRSERHEGVELWKKRLLESGFKPSEYTDLTVTLPKHCDIYYNEGLIELGYNKKPLIGVFAFEAKDEF